MSAIDRPSSSRNSGLACESVERSRTVSGPASTSMARAVRCRVRMLAGAVGLVIQRSPAKVVYQGVLQAGRLLEVFELSQRRLLDVDDGQAIAMPSLNLLRKEHRGLH